MILQEDFRQAMASLPAAVNVITTQGPAGCHGMTASAVCSLSDEPASLLLCLNRKARMHDVLIANGRFCVNVLAAGQESVSAAFASREMAMEQRLMASGGVITLQGGLPALAQAQVALACRTAQAFDGSTHTILVGLVEQILFGEGRGALAYYNRKYYSLPGIS